MSASDAIYNIWPDIGILQILATDFNLLNSEVFNK